MPNRLAQETSPYLRQHADNPVDWLPWGDEAFAKARADDKPIFLSIGYSTCHWCHVMARESFENKEIAKILNESFVPIKVDREERPDVDRVYMSYVQAMTGHGGWPLSAWLTPELKPFYGGTYFPPEDRQGRAGFATLLRAIARGWREERQKLVGQAEAAIASLREHYGPKAEAPSSSDSPPALRTQIFEAAGTAYEKCFHHLHQSFDDAHGGFGGAPKFPRASNLSFLFRCAALQGPENELSREAIGMAARTLTAMARGGIHDHVGGGFHRYSVDEAWFVPHFEKMLYDQAQIAMNALEAWQATGDERHAWLARDILDYALRDLSHPGGGFYSAEDADSPLPDAKPGGHEGHAEGAFYVWTQAEIERALGPSAAFFCSLFGVKLEGNVPPERDPGRELAGKNILAQVRPLGDSAKESGLTLQEANDRLLESLERLRAVRSGRPRPHLDDKILTAWNGLMISALALAASVPAESLADRREFYRESAIRAAKFIQSELFDEGRGVLYRSWRGSRNVIEGFAEDYAFLIQGLLDLYEATFDAHWLRWAKRLQSAMDERFWDSERGAYFNSPAGASDIIVRLKEDYDGAEPAPSSVAAMNLLRLDAVFGGGEGEIAGATQGFQERALRTLAAFRPRWNEFPETLPQMLCVLGPALEGPRHVVIAGDPACADFRALADAARERLGPRRSILAASGGSAQAWLAERAPWIAAMRPQDGKATAYICEDHVCQAPVVAPDELRKLLAGR